MHSGLNEILLDLIESLLVVEWRQRMSLEKIREENIIKQLEVEQSEDKNDESMFNTSLLFFLSFLLTLIFYIIL